MTRFQPFNDLPAARLEELKRDVEVRGVVNPILVDEQDRTIDGHQRRRVAAELGIDCPRIVMEGLTDDEKMSLAIALNTYRRHLSGTERMKALGEMARLGMSVRRIAAATGVPRSTVQDAISGVRSRTPDVPPAPEALEAPVEPAGREQGSVPPQPDPAPAPRRTGSDGKSYAASKPKPARSDDDEFKAKVRGVIAQVSRDLLSLDAQRSAHVFAGDDSTLLQFATALQMWAVDVLTEATTRPALEAVPDAS